MKPKTKMEIMTIAYVIYSTLLMGLVVYAIEMTKIYYIFRPFNLFVFCLVIIWIIWNWKWYKELVQEKDD